MATAAELVVKITADARSAAQGFKDTEQSTGKFARGVSAASKVAAVAFVAVGAAVLKAGESASRTQQAMGGLEAVFGESAGTVKAWANQAADSVGLAASSYGELATLIGSQLKNAGLPMDQVMSKTRDLITLGADLAATYGGTTQEAVAALSSALKGEFDPLERYGTSLTAAAISAQMAADGTSKLTGAAGKSAKANATLALITQQTADATGSFAREADTAAGQQQRAAAQWENTKSAIGQVALPLMTQLAQTMGGLAKFATQNATAMRAIIVVVLAVAAAVMVLNAALKVYQATMLVLQVVQKATWLANPIGLVILAVIALVAAVVLLWRKSETFRRVVLAVWSAIKTAALAVASAVKAAWRLAWALLSGYVRAYAAVIRAVWSAISAGARAVVSVVKAAWQGLWGILKAAARAYGSALSSVWSTVRSAVSSVTSWIKGKWSALWSSLKSAAHGVAGVITAPFDALRNAVDSVLGRVQSLIDKLRNIKVPHIPGLSKIVGGSAAATSGATRAAGGRSLTPALGGLTRQGAAVTAAHSGGSGGGLTINVYGVLDSADAARKIRAVLRDDDRRRTGVQVRGRS